MLQIGRYRLVEKLSDGFPGARWSARRQADVETVDTLVSLRTVSNTNLPDLIDQVSEAGFWAMEVELNGQKAVLDVVAGSGAVSCISPFHPGDTLATLRERLFERKTPAPSSVALRIAHDLLQDLRIIAEAVAGDEDAGAFAFGGINPEGVLIGFDGRARIIDVGVAAVVSRRHTLMRWDRRRLAYEVPERCGTDGDVDERADTFVIGILLWELLTGRELFRGVHAEDVASAVLNHLVEPLDATYTRRKDPFEPGLSELVARALQRDPEDRFQSIHELIEAIEALPVERCDRADVSAFIKQSAGLGSRVMQEHLASLKPPGRSNFPTPPPPAPGSVPPPAIDSIPPPAPLPMEAAAPLPTPSNPPPPMQAIDPASLFRPSETTELTPARGDETRGLRRAAIGLLVVATLIAAFVLLRSPEPTETSAGPEPRVPQPVVEPRTPKPVALPDPVEPEPEPVIAQPEPEPAVAEPEPTQAPGPDSPKPIRRKPREPKPAEPTEAKEYLPDSPF